MYDIESRAVTVALNSCGQCRREKEQEKNRSDVHSRGSWTANKTVQLKLKKM